ncbi:unnamed protein product [Vitrella brassicaformis CCMP3155]|uniref:Uncharacterized protein n=2 Tax=Vitrella brassicaformis TaxID=1169539 RepID=A0A0G4GBD6_VITBC|nr:unnamed protein product [Vitrella brassicaformis CCMP3155]|eukprot:CEM26276.1 unnamed protein product [Vitrella brassicaformis CCMP3155]
MRFAFQPKAALPPALYPSKPPRSALMYPQRYSQRLVASSATFIVPIAVAVCQNHWDFATLASLVLVTSLNHWRSPVFTSWRRRVDTTLVRGGTVYHLVQALKGLQLLPLLGFLSLTSVGASLYLMAIVYGQKGEHNRASLCHVGFHLSFVVGSCLLYCTLNPSPMDLPIPVALTVARLLPRD